MKNCFLYLKLDGSNSRIPGINHEVDGHLVHDHQYIIMINTWSFPFPDNLYQTKIWAP